MNGTADARNNGTSNVVAIRGAQGSSGTGNVPQGDLAVRLRALIDNRRDQRGNRESAEARHASGDLSANGLRLVTGSADPNLTPIGIEQAKTLRAMCAQKFDAIYNAPNMRSRETVRFFGRSITIPELSGWPRGHYEGRIAEEVKAEMAAFIENPDTVPPGVSALSGMKGKSWNASMRPMFRRVIEIMKATGTGRALVVTSGGQMQAFDAFAKADYPEDFEFDRDALAKTPYWSVTGQLFLIGRNGLQPRQNNETAGVYMIEHGETYMNFKIPQNGGKD